MRHVGSKMIWGASLMDDEVSTVIYNDFLPPQALADGRYRAAPPAPPSSSAPAFTTSKPDSTRKRKASPPKKIVITL